MLSRTYSKHIEFWIKCIELEGEENNKGPTIYQKLLIAKFNIIKLIEDSD